MKNSQQRESIVKELQKQIWAMQGLSKPGNDSRSLNLGPLEQAFPGGVFPSGAIHEFVSPGSEEAAAASGFITCLLKNMMQQHGFCLWISSKRLVFPPALKLIGIAPEDIIFIDLQSDKDVLWAVEEALRCDALIAVIGELKELSFAHSRRLQLAIEQSKTTGFIHRIQPRMENTTACAARWKISPLPGIIEAGMPGVGFPKWSVQLTKVRNGLPGAWQMGWTPNGFLHFPQTVSSSDDAINTALYA